MPTKDPLLAAMRAPSRAAAARELTKACEKAVLAHGGGELLIRYSLGCTKFTGRGDFMADVLPVASSVHKYLRAAGIEVTAENVDRYAERCVARGEGHTALEAVTNIKPEEWK